MNTLQLNMPLLFLHNQDWIMLDTDGIVHTHDSMSAQRILQTPPTPIIVCYTALVCDRLKIDSFAALDILELWAFVKPATPVVPTVSGILQALHIHPTDNSGESMAVALLRAIHTLITHIKTESGRPAMENLLVSLGKTGWGWAPPLLQVLHLDIKDFVHKPLTEGLDIWNRVPKWHNTHPPPRPDTNPITAEETTHRLRTFLGSGAENRPAQTALCESLVPAFQPKQDDTPTIVIAEGGTGVGKTYAYLAPSTTWAEKNDAPVWISTYTKNLQHQIYDQVIPLYPDKKQQHQRVVLCKGRENYLCLSRFQTLSQRVSQDAHVLKSMVLIARWAEHSIDGDINGTDFPSWLSAVIDRNGKILKHLTLKYDMGETHSGCHHDNCFVDVPLRKAKYADIVITNHAFVLHYAMRHYENDAEDRLPHIVFDEGHHLFDACDSAFCISFTGGDAYMLRRFLIKKENLDMWQTGGSLMALIDAVYKNDTTIIPHRTTLQHHAQCLVDEGWQHRLHENRPSGDMEQLLFDMYHYVHHNQKQDYGYDMEIRTDNIPHTMRTLAQLVFEQIRDILPPAQHILKQAENTLVTDNQTLYKEEKLALQNLISALKWRVIRPVETWCDILISLSENTPHQNGCDNSIDRLFLSRWTDAADTQRVANVGCIRHAIDPMDMFYQMVLRPNRGAVITSATLHDQNPDWLPIRTGAQHVQSPPIITTHNSPFDYQNNSIVLCVTDVQKNDIPQLTAAYVALFQASNGGALGLFTNIRRLQAVGKKIQPELAPQGIDVYAQHLNDITLPTLIEIFKHHSNSCLLGTDAVRDGIDVVGNSLRLLVLERMPWTLRNIVNTARDTHYAPIKYTEALVRMKLQQAFGRLLRTKSDKGVFVCLENIPSRFTSAFPKDTKIQTCTLTEACTIIRTFYNT